MASENSTLLLGPTPHLMNQFLEAEPKGSKGFLCSSFEKHYCRYLPEMITLAENTVKYIVAAEKKMVSNDCKDENFRTIKVN